MNVPNSNRQNLRQVWSKIKTVYPDAAIRRNGIGDETLQVISKKCRFVIRCDKTYFSLECTPPPVVIIAGVIGLVLMFSFLHEIIYDEPNFIIEIVAPALLGFMVARMFFALKNKAKIEQFNNSFIDIVNGIGKE